MVYVYEFEVYKGEKFLLADPYDMLGGTDVYKRQLLR